MHGGGAARLVVHAGRGFLLSVRRVEVFPEVQLEAETYVGVAELQLRLLLQEIVVVLQQRQEL